MLITWPVASYVPTNPATWLGLSLDVTVIHGHQIVGLLDGIWVGINVGTRGDAVGLGLGKADGIGLGDGLGTKEGEELGTLVVGKNVGVGDGIDEGLWLGMFVVGK
jgi:hypothetical protein